MIGWSYELLGEAERRLLQRLSVFSGGWTLETAEAICADGDALPGSKEGAALPGASEIHAATLLNLLAQLVNKSLVVAERGANAGMRYRMLETIRQYANERLVASGEAERTHNRHFEHFWRWTERVEPELRGPRQLEWLNQLEAELDNLRAALDWGLARAEYGEASLRLARALLALWRQRGHLNEGRAWLERALASPAAPTADGARANALCAAGELAHWRGDERTARMLLEASVGLWRALGPADIAGLTHALANLGEVNRALGDPAAARSLASEAITLCRAQGERWGLAYALSFLGRAVRDLEDFALARSVITESVALWQDLGDPWGLSLARQALGEVALRQGDYKMALVHFGDCLATARKLADVEAVAWALQNLGEVTLCLGDWVQAKLLLDEGLDLHRETGNQYGILSGLHDFGMLAQFEGHHQRARGYFEEALALARHVGPTFTRAGALMGLAGVAAASGQARQAARLSGAAAAQLEAGASYWNAFESLYVEQTRADAVAQLGEEKYAAAYAEGRAMTFEQAAADALEAPNDSQG